MTLASIVETRRVVVCAGAGGVGKTTVAAALALGAAGRGRRVLCLTIDPAKRLADSLGFAGTRGETLVVDPERLRALGLPAEASLTVSLLDTKRTFDDIVARHAPSAAVRDRMGLEGAEARRLLSGENDSRVAARRPPTEIAEALEFPEPVANEVTLGLAFSALLDRLLAREERGGRLPRRLAVSARLVGGGSWRRTATLREPTAESERLRQSLAPKLKELPAPAVELRLRPG